LGGVVVDQSDSVAELRAATTAIKTNLKTNQSEFDQRDAKEIAPDAEQDSRHALKDAAIRDGLPASDIEIAIAAIWSDVLEVENIGRNDNFFELGGHSLLAVRVMDQMESQGLSADVDSFFSARNLAAFAALVSVDSSVRRTPQNLIEAGCTSITPDLLPLVDLSQAEIDTVVATVPGGTANIQDIYPLAPLQQGMLFHHFASSRGDPYVRSFILGFDTRAKLDAFASAVNAAVDRHDVLRTAVIWEGLTEPVQVVWRSAPLAIEDVEPDPDKGCILEQLRARFSPRRYRLDVRKAPIMRLAIAHDPVNSRWLAVWAFHHLIDDNVSFRNLVSEIQAHLLGRQDDLLPSVPFRNFISRARSGISHDDHKTFFDSMLKDVSETTAPFGLLDVQGDGAVVHEARSTLDAALTARLVRNAKALGVGVASLAHVAWALVLARLSGRESVVFGTVLFGRLQAGEGAERALGPFINTLPIKVCAGSVSVETCVRQTHQALTGLVRHELAPLVLAQRCSGVVAPAPLFTALLNYRHGKASQIKTKSQLSLEGIETLSEDILSSYPLALSIDDIGDRLEFTAQIVAPFAPERVCGYMHQALESLAEALEHAPHTPVRDLEVLSSGERTLLLETWNATAAAYPDQACVHQLFEDQALRDPDAVALVYEEETLSYGALNTRANQLAHHLIALGVRPDARIAICVERSIEMVVGLMAILKAGGCYVPLDPAYPADRLAFMLADSAPEIVLTHAPARPALAAALAGLATPPAILDLLADAKAWSRRSRANPDPAAIGLAPTHLAYVIYTSGSTGTPKGVMVEHRNVVRLVKNNGYLAITASDVLLNSSSATFDATTFELWGALLNGARLVL
jgi:non-ribosomal peptide synthetase component F